jgi:hypothetical protein
LAAAINGAESRRRAGARRVSSTRVAHRLRVSKDSGDLAFKRKT